MLLELIYVSSLAFNLITRLNKIMKNKNIDINILLIFFYFEKNDNKNHY